MRKPQNENKGS